MANPNHLVRIPPGTTLGCIHRRGRSTTVTILPTDLHGPHHRRAT